MSPPLSLIKQEPLPLLAVLQCVMLFGLTTFVLGVATALYLSANGQVGKLLGSPIVASVPFFATALLASVAFMLASGQSSAMAGLRSVPGPLLLTGVASALMILGTTILVPKLGASPFFVVLLAGQLVGGALLISHFGWFSSPVTPVAVRQIAGVGLVIVGASLALWPN